MSTLWITRGLPGSGKTTWAREQLEKRPRGEIVRLNRDELRRMALDEAYAEPTQQAERWITAIRNAALGELLRSGCDVICDDTNLSWQYVNALVEAATLHGAQVRIKDFTDVPLDECIRRDEARPGRERVGEVVIRRMHETMVNQPPVNANVYLGPAPPNPACATALEAAWRDT